MQGSKENKANNPQASPRTNISQSRKHRSMKLEADQMESHYLPGGQEHGPAAKFMYKSYQTSVEDSQ